ncbi:MAG: hypothetical protein E4G96_08820 [Chrysiogenales bacterium]|nr:MAG: hypothetical protein E4G96_08820 [Chrysiogenales bacterium]
MLKRKALVITVTILAMAAFNRVGDGQVKYQWKLVKTNGGASIYTSVVPGKEYIAAKCVDVINAPMDVIGVVLRDIPNFPAWMADCNSTKVLKVVSDEQDLFIFHLHQHVPLLKDRDVILKSHVILNYKKGWSYIGTKSTTEISYSPSNNLIRMPSFAGAWKLEWIDTNTTRATFMIDPDLGKGLPIAIANSTIRDIPYKSIQGMKKMVKQATYIDAAKKSKYRQMIDNAIKAGYLK